MKTTVEAKKVAAREHTTVRALIEQGLRRILAERKRRTCLQLRKATFKGKGLQPPLEGSVWERIRDRAYEGRGA